MTKIRNFLSEWRRFFHNGKRANFSSHNFHAPYYIHTHRIKRWNLQIYTYVINIAFILHCVEQFGSIRKLYLWLVTFLHYTILMREQNIRIHTSNIFSYVWIVVRLFCATILVFLCCLNRRSIRWYAWYVHNYKLHIYTKKKMRWSERKGDKKKYCE